MPKVAQSIIDSRREDLAALLAEHTYLPVHEVCRRLRISEATARRDLAALAKSARVTRTYGGAMGDYNTRFAAFEERQKRAHRAKARIAAEAWKQIRPGMMIFLDGGTTLLAFALTLLHHPVADVKIVTNSVAVAEKLAASAAFDVHVLGGQFLHRQSVLLGSAACSAARRYRIDLALLGAEAADTQGIWNSHRDVADLQRAVVSRSKRSLLLLDRTKLRQRAPEFLFSYERIDQLISDASRKDLAAAGIALPSDALITV